MSNPYFQFKKFIIHQEGAPLKVTTDACLFGALIETVNAKSILDIGTGTGLLALMIAQKSQASCILGIEVDKLSSDLAERNFSKSLWKEKMKIIHSDILLWSEYDDSKFDLIVCNPPFFTSHKKMLMYGNHWLDTMIHFRTKTYLSFFQNISVKTEKHLSCFRRMR